MAKAKSVRRRVVFRKRTHRKAGLTVPLALVAGFVPTAGYALEGFRRGGEAGITEGIARLTVRMTGYSITENKFNGSELIKGWAPVALGFMTHKLAARMGINRALSNAGVPILRV
jgi:hypothetical protein